MVSDSFSFKTRAVFAGQHIQSAILFTRLCASIETNYKGRPSYSIPTDIYDEQKAYVTAAIFASVSFLEAAINELFVDATELEQGELVGTLVGRLTPTVKKLMAEMWSLGVPRSASFPILQKFNIALTLARKNLLDDDLYQEANLVIKLRNALTHFEPVWTLESTPYSTTYYEIYKGTPSKKLNSLENKFSNPLVAQSEPFFPNRCLCHACAQWAVTSCLKFAKAFYSRIGITKYPPRSIMNSPLV